MTDGNPGETGGQGQNGGAATTGAGAAAGQGTGQQQASPKLSIVNQYIKDLSFENPHAPQGIQQQQRPEIQIKVDTRSQPVSEDRHECVLELSINAKSGESTVFMLELSYGGVFSVANIPNESLQPLLLIECPRLLFPFARRIVADATRDGGFPPLMIDPIDFVALYRRKIQQAQQQAQAASQAANPTGQG